MLIKDKVHKGSGGYKTVVKDTETGQVFEEKIERPDRLCNVIRIIFIIVLVYLFS